MDVVSMPKAAIHKNTSSVLPHHNVWFPGHTRMIQPIAESVSPQIATHYNFWLRVLSVDSRHVRMTLLWGMDVTHIA